MYHAIQFPLAVYFAFSPQGKTVNFLHISLHKFPPWLPDVIIRLLPFCAMPARRSMLFKTEQEESAGGA